MSESGVEERHNAVTASNSLSDIDRAQRTPLVLAGNTNIKHVVPHYMFLRAVRDPNAHKLDSFLPFF